MGFLAANYSYSACCTYDDIPIVGSLTMVPIGFSNTSIAHGHIANCVTNAATKGHAHHVIMQLAMLLLVVILYYSGY